MLFASNINFVGITELLIIEDMQNIYVKTVISVNLCEKLHFSQSSRHISSPPSTMTIASKKSRKRTNDERYGFMFLFHFSE